MSVPEVNKKMYYLIDKIIIDTNNVLTFDLFQKAANKKLILAYQKNTPLTKELTSSLISISSLYVFEPERELYENFHREFLNAKIVSKKMYNVYKDVSKYVSELFENPESMENLQNAKENVTNMVSTILEDDFTVSSFLQILAYDYYTHTHSLNVSVYAICLGKYLKMGESELEELGTAALLHDIGKSKIDSAIINKDGKLTNKEFKLVQEHPWLGWDILARMGIKNKNILAGVRNHHEKMDGTGYPDGLEGKNIHLYARIIGICDVFDALTTKRSYKNPVSTFNTLLMMKKEMKDHLDERLVNRFILMFREENDIV